jgi:hypothetical protein
VGVIVDAGRSQAQSPITASSDTGRSEGFMTCPQG